ncbi:MULTISPECIES: hypothetical protein [Sphingobacterium]|uniref:hypothetical protein n=1 Tax=Sphingobacterium TaxID=28453 RepID=UPI0028ADAA3D|nr:hypothetical protein [Sphingobacterium multivorum]
MKRNYFMLAIIILMAATGCHKPLQDNHLENDQLDKKAGLKNITVDCTPITLSGSITSNMTLLTGKTYLLDGIVDVKGATLTIQPGTLILGKSSVESALVIDKTGQINAVGTATSPIVFTSDKAAGSRAAGDWLGVFIFGNAPNNQSNSLGFTLGSNSYTAGGTNATSSAGSLQYVQIHFAGKGNTAGDRLTQSSLVMASVGSGMTIRDIQITNSKFDGLGMYGGLAGVKEIFSYKSGRNEFPISQGYRGNMQSLFGYKDNATTTGTDVPMMDITNYLVGSDAAPYTYPTISNASLLGGTYCSGGDLDFNRGIEIRLNGNAQIYNSVIEGFDQHALYLNGSNIIAKTKATTDRLIFSFSSLRNSGINPYASNPSNWQLAGGCVDVPNGKVTMQDWIDGSSLASCTQSGNQLALSASGYDNSTLCGNKCSAFPHLYINEATTDLDAPDYSMLPGFFNQPDYRGALQPSASTWLTSGWIDFCSATRDYCQ